MKNASLQQSWVVDGDGISRLTQVSGKSHLSSEETIPAAKPGTLTQLTDFNTGQLTMAGGHGIITGNHIDVFWDGGKRRNMVVGTVSGNVVPVDGGTGDPLPALSTVISAMKPVVVTFGHNNTGSIDVATYASSPVPGFVVFSDGVGEVAAATFSMNGDGDDRVWISGIPLTANPLAAKGLASVSFSHGSLTPQIMKAGVIVG